MGIDEIKTILEEANEVALKEFKANIVGIFGSYTRGEQRENSDLDVLVNFLEGASLFDLVGLADFLEEKLFHPCRCNIEKSHAEFGLL